MLFILSLEDRNKASVGESLGPSNANNIEHQFRVSLDMAVAKIKAYMNGALHHFKKEKDTHKRNRCYHRTRSGNGPTIAV